MGVHAGTGELSEGDYVGIDVHRAARIAAAGHGGQILLSEATRILAAAGLPAGARLRDVGEHRLKDLPGTERLFQVVVEGLPTDFPPVRSLDQASGGNLPESSTSLVGRDVELDAIASLLGEARLVTLTGPGGTGKTRLSIEVARRLRSQFADGAWFVALDGIRDPALALPAIASNLSVQEQADRPIEAVLADHLARRQLLLVLDNLEQIVAAGPAIGRVVAAAPRCRAVASSREPLRVSGEQEYPVPPLASDPAVDLFVERARLARPDFSPDEAARRAVAEICERVDRLPLAIELAAARIRILSPDAILARLGQRLNLLAGGGRDLTDRQRTLRGAIAWSFDLLEPDERRFFAGFSVFVGSAGIDAVEAVLPGSTGDRAALDLCGSLVEKSLLRQFDGPDGEPRFSMLETIREYAAEQLAADPDGTEVRERQARHVMALAEQLEPELVGMDPKRAFDLLDLDLGNIRVAIDWSIESRSPQVGLRIGAAIWRFWQHRSHLAEGRSQMTELLAADGADVPLGVRARAMTALGGVRYWQGDFEVADDLYRTALPLYRELGDARSVALALYDLGFTTAILRDLDEAGRLQEESLRLFLELGDERMATTVREGIAVQSTIAGRHAEAYEMQLKVIAYYRAAQLPFKLEDGLTFLASTEVMLGRLAEAREHLRESVGIARAIGDASVGPTQLQVGALLAAGEGNDALGAALVGAFLRLNETIGPLLVPLKPLKMPDPEELLRGRMAAGDFDRAAAVGAAAGLDAMLDRLVGALPAS
jgi:predicted ATPase